MKKILFILVLMLVLTGCGERDTSTVGNALVGHWVTNEEEVINFYISKDKFTSVINGTKTVYDYEIVSENDGRKEITIITKNTEDSGMKYKLNFTSEEMTEIESTTDIMDIKSSGSREQEAIDLVEILASSLNVDTKIEEVWKYVDDKIEP